MEQEKPLQLLPLGTSDFGTLRLRNQIYVDKTEYVYKLASVPEKFFLARPRRFGKSLLISTFESLFKYGLRDFKGLAIEKLWNDKGLYEVVRLDFSEIKNFSDVEHFKQELDKYFDDLMEVNGYLRPIQKNDGVRAFKNWLAVQPSNSVVLLIDEYDAPLTACLNDKKNFNLVREILADFYSTVKAKDRALRFFFMTGITKFNKTSIFSELNNLSDITLDPTYGSLLGYTHKEVEKYFTGYLKRASDLLEIDTRKLLEELTKQYDGFCFETTATQKVFSPWSLLKFFASPQNGLIDYWFESGGRPTVLIEYMQSHTFKNPEEYAKEKSISLPTLSLSSDVETLSDIGLLTQAGYLTIKSVEDDDTVFVDYPNEEVRKAMAKLYVSELLDGKTLTQVGAGKLDQVLMKESAESVFHILNKLFKSIDYKDYPVVRESIIQAIMQVAICATGLEANSEVHNSYGRSDIEVKARNRHWVFELKIVKADESSEKKLQEATEQIIERDYGSTVRNRNLHRVALVFSVEKRKFIKWREV